MGTFTKKDKETLDELRRLIFEAWDYCFITVMQSESGSDILKEARGDLQDVLETVSAKLYEEGEK